MIPFNEQAGQCAVKVALVIDAAAGTPWADLGFTPAHRPPAVSDAPSPSWHGGGRVTGHPPRAVRAPGVLAKSTCLCCVAFLFYAQGIKVQAARPALQVTLLCAVLEADRGQSPRPTSRHTGIVQSSGNFPETHSSLVIDIVRPDDIRVCSCQKTKAKIQVNYNLTYKTLNCSQGLRFWLPMQTGV